MQRQSDVVSRPCAVGGCWEPGRGARGSRAIGDPGRYLAASGHRQTPQCPTTGGWRGRRRSLQSEYGGGASAIQS